MQNQPQVTFRNGITGYSKINNPINDNNKQMQTSQYGGLREWDFKSY